MKKALALILALTLIACALAGCNNTDPADSGEPDSSTTPADNNTAPADGDGETDASGDEIDYSYYSAGLDENGYFEGVVAKDIVTLPQYKGVTIPANVTTADPFEVEYLLYSQVLSSYAEELQITDRAVENYDTINIDYTGYVDDVAFDGGSTQGAGTEVTIGVTSYIDDFLEQLIGHMPGETFDIFVTFPESYPNNPDLENKEARFNVTINYIVDYEDVELTDEIAKDFGFDTKEELRARAEEIVINDYRSSFLNDILSSAECENIPESVTTYFTNYIKGYYKGYGMELTDEDMGDFADSIREMSITYLAAQAIAETEGLTVTDADLEAIGITPYLDVYGVPFAKQAALTDKLIPDLIISNGVPEETAEG